MGPLLLLLACAPRPPVAEAPAPPSPAASEPAEPGPPLRPVARGCEEVVVDASGAVDLAAASVIPARPRRIGPPSRNYAFADGEVRYLAADGSWHQVRLDGRDDRAVPEPEAPPRAPPTEQALPPPEPGQATVRLEPEWPPTELPGDRHAIIQRGGHELWVVESSGEVACAGRTDGTVPSFFAAVGDELAWTVMRGHGAERDWELHWTDLATGTDHLLGTVAGADMVVLKAVPGERRLVATVRRTAADTLSFYDVPLDGESRRIGPEVPAGPDPAVGPGAAVVFAVEAPRPKPPPPPDPPPRLDDDFDRPACDPVPCPSGACGYMSDHCGGTQFCGECPEDRVAPDTRRGGLLLGLYVVTP